MNSLSVMSGVICRSMSYIWGELPWRRGQTKGQVGRDNWSWRRKSSVKPNGSEQQRKSQIPLTAVGGIRER